MNAKDNSDVVDILCEFFEVAIHNIIYIRKLYPEGVFVKRKKYGIAIYQIVHPQLNEYIVESLKAIKFHVKANQLKRLYLSITGLNVLYEKFVFEILNLQNIFENDSIYLTLESNLRDFYLKLHGSSGHLQKLPKDATFRIILQTTEYSSSSFIENPAFDNFPWIHINNENKTFIPEIVPLHTLEMNFLVLQIYVEKANKNL